jgi:Spy/CpxP family protein refolding chaperone
MKTRSSALVVIIAVLFIGCLLGIAGYHFFGKEPQKTPAISDIQRTQVHAGRLSGRLQLTQEQDAQLKTILEESRQQIYTGRMEWDAKLQDIRAKTNEKITAILNGEQKKIFKQILSEAQSHEQSGAHGHGHGDH